MRYPQCGACVVHVDGVSMKSCTLLTVAADGKSVTPSKGWPRRPGADCIRCRRRFIAIRPAVRVLHTRHDHERSRFRQADAGSAKAMSAAGSRQHLPFTGYQNIVASVLAGAAAMRTRAGVSS